MAATYSQVCNLLNEKKYSNAEHILNSMDTKDATWHFLYSQLMLKKSWFEAAKTHLEKALSLDPDSTIYQNAMVKLMGRSHRYTHDYYGRRPYRRRHGCCCCCDDCCCEFDCCDLICLDTCCECAGGDLIECI